MELYHQIRHLVTRAGFTCFNSAQLPERINLPIRIHIPTPINSS